MVLAEATSSKKQDRYIHKDLQLTDQAGFVKLQHQFIVLFEIIFNIEDFITLRFQPLQYMKFTKKKVCKPIKNEAFSLAT